MNHDVQVGGERTAKIGFFDSGLGGLTIFASVRALLPDYDYRYYGDTLHVPYGDRKEEEIYELTKAGVAWLFEEGCTLVVIACNTSSAETLRRLQDTYLPHAYPDRRILGVVIPTIEELIESGTRNALLIATRRTIESRKYEIELLKRNITHLALRSVATSELVPLIEKGDLIQAARSAIRTIEQEREGADTVILGCTHYVLLKDAIRDHFNNSSSVLHVISQDELIPRKLAQYLMHHPEIETQLSQEGTYALYLTAHGEEYETVCSRLFVTA